MDAALTCKPAGAPSLETLCPSGRGKVSTPAPSVSSRRSGRRRRSECRGSGRVLSSTHWSVRLRSAAQVPAVLRVPGHSCKTLPEVLGSFFSPKNIFSIVKIFKLFSKLLNFSAKRAAPTHADAHAPTGTHTPTDAHMYSEFLVFFVFSFFSFFYNKIFMFSCLCLVLHFLLFILVLSFQFFV